MPEQLSCYDMQMCFLAGPSNEIGQNKSNNIPILSA